MGIELRRTRIAMLVIGLAQGLLLLLADVAGDHAPFAGNFSVIIPWYAVALGVPTTLLLCLTDVSDRRIWLVAALFGFILGMAGFYNAMAVVPETQDQRFAIFLPFALTAFFAWHVALPFAQTFLSTGQWRPDYADLFQFAWNNFLTLLIAELFVALFASLLSLWGALFELIHIDVFQRIFASPYFGYPVYATVFAFAISLGRRNVAAIETVRSVVLAVFRGLLPLLALIAVLFLVVLPFMGLDPLWSTGHATALLLTMLILNIVFVNAVFQDGTGAAPYAPWLREGLRGAFVLLPVYALLCSYALSLRIAQHGWSVDRFWAALLCALVGLYAVGYAAVALRPDARWMGRLPQVNIVLAMWVVALGVLVNSPLLDPYRITVNSQVGRLLTGAVSAESFDYEYLRFELGARGLRALKALQETKDHPQAETIHARAGEALAKANHWPESENKAIAITQAEAQRHFVVFPKGQALDREFLQFAMGRTGTWQFSPCFRSNQTCPVLQVDLNGDKLDEYVVFAFSGANEVSVQLYVRLDQGWRHKGELVPAPRLASISRADAETALGAGDHQAVDTTWRDLRVGQLEFVLRRTDR